MRQLLKYLLLFLPFVAQAQVSGSIQKTPATGTVRGNFGVNGIDSIAVVTGTATNNYGLRYNSTKKKFEFVASIIDTTGLARKVGSDDLFIYGTTLTGKALTVVNGTNGNFSTVGQEQMSTGSLKLVDYNSTNQASLEPQRLTANRTIKFQNKSYTVADSATVAAKQDAITISSVSNGGNSNGMSLSSGTLRLFKVNASNPGILSTGTDTIAGIKTFISKVIVTSASDSAIVDIAGNLTALRAISRYSLNSGTKWDVGLRNGGNFKIYNHSTNASPIEIDRVTNRVFIPNLSLTNLSSGTAGTDSILVKSSSNRVGKIAANYYAPTASPTFTGTVTIPNGSNLGTPTTLVGTNITGTASALSIGGNAATATVLETARNIQGVSFNGSANINIINGTGFVKASGTTISYDNSTYLTASTGVSSITGTSNQVIASGSTGAVTLSLPQSIATSSVPQFSRLGLGGTSNYKLFMADTSSFVYTPTGSLSSTPAALSELTSYTISNTSGTEGSGVFINFQPRRGSNSQFTYIGGISATTNNTGIMVFGRRNGDGWAESMRLNISGNLLIGSATNTSGDEKLQVAGTASISSNLLLGGNATISGTTTISTSGAATQLRVNRTNTNAAGVIQMMGGNSSSSAAGIEYGRVWANPSSNTAGSEAGVVNISARNSAGSIVTGLTISPSAVTLASLAGTGTRMVEASSTGELSATNIVTSGNYTPTLTNVSNVTSSSASQIMRWQQIGNVVSFSVELTAATMTGAGAAQLDFSIPVSSNFLTSARMPSSVSWNITSAATDVYVVSDATNDRGSLYWTSNGQPVSFIITGHYEIE